MTRDHKVLATENRASLLRYSAGWGDMHPDYPPHTLAFRTRQGRLSDVYLCDRSNTRGKWHDICLSCLGRTCQVKAPSSKSHNPESIHALNSSPESVATLIPYNRINPRNLHRGTLDQRLPSEIFSSVTPASMKKTPG
jgi:hypothetical protein